VGRPMVLQESRQQHTGSQAAALHQKWQSQQRQVSHQLLLFVELHALGDGALPLDELQLLLLPYLLLLPLLPPPLHLGDFLLRIVQLTVLAPGRYGPHHEVYFV